MPSYQCGESSGANRSHRMPGDCKTRTCGTGQWRMTFELLEKYCKKAGQWWREGQGILNVYTRIYIAMWWENDQRVCTHRREGTSLIRIVFWRGRGILGDCLQLYCRKRLSSYFRFSYLSAICTALTFYRPFTSMRMSTFFNGIFIHVFLSTLPVHLHSLCLSIWEGRGGRGGGYIETKRRRTVGNRWQKGQDKRTIRQDKTTTRQGNYKTSQPQDKHKTRQPRPENQKTKQQHEKTTTRQDNHKTR